MQGSRTEKTRDRVKMNIKKCMKRGAKKRYVGG